MARAPIGTLDRPLRIPAPVGGMNSVSPGTQMPESDCIYAYNLIASELGLVSRTGWREYVTGLTGSVDSRVRTTIPFHGSTGSANKLFATTDTGIWDVTSSTDSPTQAHAFTTYGGDAGWGVAAAVVTSAGHFLLYADEVNGLHYYSESTGLWAAYTTGSGTGQVTGVDPASVVSVTVWKNRVWLTERGTAKAYYLDAGAIFGTATAFNFGGRLAHGGYLVGLFNWSTDGGSGLDTALVGIGSGGDVVIYIGTDPASATTFALKGVWFVGAVPAGRNIATDFGGDLFILSSLGLMPLSRLIVGGAVEDGRQYATAKISNLFSSLVRAGRSVRGWAVHTHPTDSALLIFVPVPGETATIQLAMSTTSRGWSRYRDIPMLSAAVWDGQLYFGTDDGRVCRNAGVVDNVTLADPGGDAQAIQYSLLTRYQGSASNVQVQAIRPIILADEADPLLSATAKYDWNTEEPDEPSGTTDGGSGSWDYGLVTGTVSEDTQGGNGRLPTTLTSTPDFPAADGTIRVAEGTAFEEFIQYLTWDGDEFVVDGSTVQDHVIGHTVRLVSAPTDSTGTWDNALWGGAARSSVRWRGAVGAGKDFAIAIRGAAWSRTVLVGIDVAYQAGGLL